jgi:anaphase-promoting complex subunit 6
MLKLNRADQAKTCFMEALALDVKCADAFSQLVNAEMLSPDEGLSISCLHSLIGAEFGY